MARHAPRMRTLNAFVIVLASVLALVSLMTNVDASLRHVVEEKIARACGRRSHGRRRASRA